ncbi:Csu type fimbrial protein [Phyllobacterium chamaecytisi]|uniref:Csu type fimbrial protein n=1 Tax=Phyllobacterium chamaecytisi TaxID=2876082 RepID=UPI001CCFC528|nr:spore coat U domain-containing protein [Phyllobacterium sp. KW56]MBZ9601991.1 spore coat U domain-containing protein [Phyllobacterium sp. KW56]
MTPRFPIRIACAAVLAASFGLTGSAFAASKTGTLNVKLTIIEGCSVFTTNSANSTMDFGTWSTLSDNIDASTTFNVSCTSAGKANQTVEVGLDKGQNAGAGNDRYLVDGANKIKYTLFKDSGYTQSWGNTGSDLNVKPLPATPGSNVAFTVYGRVPSTSTVPVAGTYTDKVTVSVEIK